MRLNRRPRGDISVLRLLGFLPEDRRRRALLRSTRKKRIVLNFLMPWYRPQMEDINTSLIVSQVLLVGRWPGARHLTRKPLCEVNAGGPTSLGASILDSNRQPARCTSVQLVNLTAFYPYGSHAALEHSLERLDANVWPWFLSVLWRFRGFGFGNGGRPFRDSEASSALRVLQRQETYGNGTPGTPWMSEKRATAKRRFKLPS